VQINLQRPGASFNVTWYDTQTGQPTSTQMLTANANGVVSLTVNGLDTDTAAKIAPSGE
jgi:hypothetical protein